MKPESRQQPPVDKYITPDTVVAGDRGRALSEIIDPPDNSAHIPGAKKKEPQKTFVGILPLQRGTDYGVIFQFTRTATGDRTIWRVVRQEDLPPFNS